MNKALILVVLVALVGGGIYLYQERADETASPAGTVEENSGINDGPAGGQATSPQSGTGIDINIGVGTVKEFTVTSKSFSFDPKTITVKKGDRVRIVLNNTAGNHDWKVDEFNAATKVIQGAGTDKVEFVADKAGSFEYYCSVGTHRAQGMKGTLVVQP